MQAALRKNKKRGESTSREDARKEESIANYNDSNHREEEQREPVSRPKENLLKRQQSTGGSTNKTDAAARAPERRKRGEKRESHNETKRRHRHRDHARRRHEKRAQKQELDRIRALDRQRTALLTINAGIHRDNRVVGGIIAAARHLPHENNPLLHFLLQQHILYETHRYTLKLLQDEVFVALRQELESERPREYILQRLILPETNSEEGAAAGTDLDQLVNVLRVLPLDQLIRLLKPPTQT